VRVRLDGLGFILIRKCNEPALNFDVARNSSEPTALFGLTAQSFAFGHPAPIAVVQWRSISTGLTCDAVFLEFSHLRHSNVRRSKPLPRLLTAVGDLKCELATA